MQRRQMEKFGCGAEEELILLQHNISHTSYLSQSETCGEWGTNSAATQCPYLTKVMQWAYLIFVTKSTCETCGEGGGGGTRCQYLTKVMQWVQIHPFNFLFYIFSTCLLSDLVSCWNQKLQCTGKSLDRLCILSKSKMCNQTLLGQGLNLILYLYLTLYFVKV